MIRPLTLVTALLAAGSGAYLFAVKHRAQMLDNQIAAVSEASRLDAQRIRVLEAQWALETDPTRLQQLAARFTALQPMQPAQLVTLAALRADLPRPGSAPPGYNPAEPSQPQPDLIASAGPDAGSAGMETAGGLPLPPPRAPLPEMGAMPAPLPAATRVAAVASVAPRPTAARTGRPVPRSVAQRSLTQRSLTQRSLAQPSLLAGARFAEAMPLPRPYEPPHGSPPATLPQEARTPPVAAMPVADQVSRTPPVSVAGSASALGMAVSVPPPQPLAEGGAEN